MFDLELSKVIAEINQRESKRVLIQLPDGLKTQSKEIVDKIESNTKALVLIWYSSCFGACDMPLGLDVLKIDLMIQWGHNRYWKTQEIW